MNLIAFATTSPKSARLYLIQINAEFPRGRRETIARKN
jgi:hypothetical protein